VRTVTPDKIAGTNGQAEPANLPISNAEPHDKLMLPRSIDEIAASIFAACGNWPRRVGSDLFAHEPGHAVRWLRSSQDLFSWIGSRTGRPARFAKIVGVHSKEEVFAGLRAVAEKYDAIELLPHEPQIAGRYYACDVPPPGDGGTLRKLVERFTPQTLVDADLIKAAFVTIVWGGPGGARPCFVVTSRHGRGTGKTAFADVLGYFASGAIALSANENSETVKHRLLSPEGLTKRVVLLDNVKTRGFSWPELESLITAPEISGKRMYAGEGSRPNNLLWVVTLNGVSLATDMAQRAIIIELAQPEHSPSWKEDTLRFIDDNRKALIADCIGFLRSKRAALLEHSRFGAWERDVLSRLPEPSEARKVILERQGTADTEAETADIVQDYFRAELMGATYSPDVERVFIPSKIAAEWFNEATHERATTTAVSQWLKQHIDEKKLPCLMVNKCKTYGRGFIWVGADVEPDEPTKTDLECRLSAQRERRVRGF
jgi:hypothetical protein